MPKNSNEEKLNPCLKEQRITFKCFDDNAYDKEKCEKAIQNYKNCKTFWHQVKAARRRQGITPYLPDVEERNKIQAEYFSKVNK